jgi:hypothetical protein
VDQNENYDRLLEVEKLETLLEDVEDSGSGGEVGTLDMDGDLRARMVAAGVNNTEELRARIASLHSKLDVLDSEG